MSNETQGATRGTEFPADLLKRWVLFGFAVIVGGELLFALLSGLLDNRGPVADFAGHLPTLLAFGAAIYLVNRRALGLPASWIGALACGVPTFLGYGLGFALIGPPADFFFGLVLPGVATGITIWLTLRRRITGAGWCVAAVGIGYAVGAAAGAAAMIMFGDAVDHAFGSGVTGFMGVVGMFGIIAGVIGPLLSGLALTRVLGKSGAGDRNLSTAS